MVESMEVAAELCLRVVDAVDFLPFLWSHLWPGWDALWPNILASIICGTAVWLWARRHIHRLHHKIDRIHKHLGVDNEPPQQETKPPT